MNSTALKSAPSHASEYRSNATTCLLDWQESAGGLLSLEACLFIDWLTKLSSYIQADINEEVEPLWKHTHLFWSNIPSYSAGMSSQKNRSAQQKLAVHSPDWLVAFVTPCAYSMDWLAPLLILASHTPTPRQARFQV